MHTLSLQSSTQALYTPEIYAAGNYWLASMKISSSEQHITSVKEGNHMIQSNYEGNYMAA